MKNDCKYGFTITMRRSREEIISGVKTIVDPTLRPRERLSQKRIINQICKLAADLEKSKTLSHEAKITADELYYNACKLKNLISTPMPQWRILDKSLSS